jgi:hypothetical protein
MTEDGRRRLVRWPLILACCFLVFAVWPTLGFAYALAAFEIEGDAAGELSPGITVPIELRFVNKHPTPMTISELEVSLKGIVTPAADAGRPCSLNDYLLTQMAMEAEWTVPPNTTLSLRELGIPRTDWPQITMLSRSVNQDGCKGATLTLGYTAHGELGR